MMRHDGLNQAALSERVLPTPPCHDQHFAIALTIFDQLSVGVVLLDRSIRVVFANSAAQSLFKDGALHLNCRVASRAAEQARWLRDFIWPVLDSGLVRTMCLPRGRGRPLMLLASPVRGEECAGRPDPSAATAMLLVCDPDQAAQIPTGWIMDAYGLTSAEVRVALSVASGLSISHTAQQLKISVNTVKTHLRRVYEKTGTRGQAELSRIMATIGLVRGDQPKKSSHPNCATRRGEATNHSGPRGIPIAGLIFVPAG